MRAIETADTAITDNLFRRMNFRTRWGHRGRAGFQGITTEVNPVNIVGQGAGGLIPSSAVFLQGLHDNPVQVPTDVAAQPFGVDASVLG